MVQHSCGGLSHTHTVKGCGGDPVARQKFSCHLLNMLLFGSRGAASYPRTTAKRRRAYRKFHRESVNLNIAVHPNSPLLPFELRYGHRSSLHASEYNRIGGPGFQVLILKIVQCWCLGARVWNRSDLLPIN